MRDRYTPPPRPPVPVYIVITDRDYQTQNLYGVDVQGIREVIPATLDQLDAVYQAKIRPLYDAGQNVSYFVFRREPPNPLRELVEGKPKDEGPANA